jgi:hypothetical protein
MGVQFDCILLFVYKNAFYVVCNNLFWDSKKSIQIYDLLFIQEHQSPLASSS